MSSSSSSIGMGDKAGHGQGHDAHEEEGGARRMGGTGDDEDQRKRKDDRAAESRDVHAEPDAEPEVEAEGHRSEEQDGLDGVRVRVRSEEEEEEEEEEGEDRSEGRLIVQRPDMGDSGTATATATATAVVVVPRGHGLEHGQGQGDRLADGQPRSLPQPPVRDQTPQTPRGQGQGQGQTTDQGQSRSDGDGDGDGDRQAQTRRPSSFSSASASATALASALGAAGGGPVGQVGGNVNGNGNGNVNAGADGNGKPTTMTSTTTSTTTATATATTAAAAAKRFGLDYTTKGRKRKRLAKACSACHKNKRRCDGFAPCSNCEFSNRECVYVNSLGEAIPPPRTREGSITPNTPGGETDLDGPSRRHSGVALLPAALGGSRRSSSSKHVVESLHATANANPPVSGFESSHVRSPERFEGRGAAATAAAAAAASSRSSFGGFDRLGGTDASTTGDPGSYHARQHPSSGAFVDEDLEREKRWRNKVVDLVMRDDTLVEELVHLFFAKLPPYGMMFHVPTFQYRRYIGETVPCLIHIMLALSVRFLDHALLVPYSATRRRDGQPFPAHLKGEPFADRAKEEVDAWITSHPDVASLGRRASAWERTEWATAMCLIKVYETCLGRASSALYYQDLAIDMMRPGSISYAPYIPPTGTPTVVAIEASTMLEAQTRTLWMLYIGDCSAAANGRPRHLSDVEMAEIMLPGDEAAWQRWGGFDVTSRAIGRPTIGSRYLGIDARPIVPEEASRDGAGLGEFAHVLRISAIFSDIMALSNRRPSSQSPGARHQSIAFHENALKNWALSLPIHFRFDENNLYTSIQKLSSPLPSVSTSGWCYAYMHAMAESGMFYLQTAALALGQVAPEISSQRQSQAVDNLGVILQSIGEVGRGSPLMLFPLSIVSSWQAHTSHAASTSTSNHAAMNLESMLFSWWAEITRLWGVRRSATFGGGPYGVSSSFSHEMTATALDKPPAPPTRQVIPGPLRPPLPLQSMSEMIRTQSYSTPRLSDLLNGSEAPAAVRDIPRDRRMSLMQLKGPAGATSSPVSPLVQHVSPLQAPQDGESSGASASSSSVRSNLLRTPEEPLRSVRGDDDVAMADSDEPPSFNNNLARRKEVEQDDFHSRQAIRSDPPRSWVDQAHAVSVPSWDRRHHSLTVPTLNAAPLSRIRSDSLAEVVAGRRGEWRDSPQHQTTADAEVERRRLLSHPMAMHGAGGGRFAALLDVVGERMR